MWLKGIYTAISNCTKRVTTLHREVECKVEKVKHMKLQVMQLKAKTNMTVQAE